MLHLKTFCKYVRRPKSISIFSYKQTSFVRNCKTRVVVTGLGIVSPLGVGVQHAWKRILQGEVGTVPIKHSDYKDIPCKVAAFVPKGNGKGELDLDKEFKKSDLQKFSLATAYGLVAAKEALLDANWPPECDVDCEKTGVAVGMGMVNLSDIMSVGKVLYEKGYGKVSPYFIPRVLGNMAAGNISIKYGFKGPNHSVSTACTTGLHAIGDAYLFIKHGYTSVMVCGGTEAVICPLSVAGFCRLRALSTQFNSCPSKASRPFDEKRDGFVMGEGAGMLVLESLEHALRRNSKIYAEVMGYGLSGDAHHITSPSADGTGAYLSMRCALNDGLVDPCSVGYINAHATSTPLGDKAEISAIKKLFGNHASKLSISSLKGALGHLLGASGSVEAIFTILACHTGCVPHTANLEHSDCDDGVNLVSTKMQTWPKEISNCHIALSNSFGFGGTNASVIFSSYETK